MKKKFESSDPLRRRVKRPIPPRPRIVKPTPHLPLANPATASAPPPNAPGTAPAGYTTNTPTNQPQMPGEPGDGSKFQEFALRMCTDEDLQDSRFHIFRFQAKNKIDMANDFVPPIKLHRKDPKQLQVIAGETMSEDDDLEMSNVPTVNGIHSAEAKAQAVLGEDGKNEQKRRPFERKKKTRQIHGGEKADAARKLRYEEHYPWILEDFEGKNTWVSSYEAALSNNHAILTYDPVSNGFKVIPIEKYYKMTQMPKYATLSLEDAEERMETTNSFRNRWLMSRLQPHLAQQMTEPSGPRMRTVVGSEERQHKYNVDEELDYDENEMFDDDEGAPIMDGPEDEVKEAEERIKREQLKANELMDVGKDADIDALFDDDQRSENKQGKKLRKALRSLEKNQYYDSEDEENPYISSPDESDSNDELVKDATSMELGSIVKREEDDMPLPMLSRFRKKHINRDNIPVGTAVLQLPPELLKNFPAGEWNPNAKRVAQPMATEDPNLLTRDDVRNNIKSGETDIKRLLNALKPKLALHPDNVARLRQFVKEVARSKDKKLYLRNN